MTKIHHAQAVHACKGLQMLQVALRTDYIGRHGESGRRTDVPAPGQRAEVVSHKRVLALARHFESSSSVSENALPDLTGGAAG